MRAPPLNTSAPPAHVPRRFPPPPSFSTQASRAALGAGGHLLLPPLLALTPATALVDADAAGTAWPGWTLAGALGSRSTEPFAGGATAVQVRSWCRYGGGLGSPPHPPPFPSSQPDLTLSVSLPRGLPPSGAPPDAWHVEHVADAVASVVGSCERLQLQAVGLEAGFSNPQRLLAVALVERLVHDVLPLPRASPPPPPPAASLLDSRPPLLWHERPPPATFTSDAQTALLLSLGALLRHYLAAVYSTAATEGGGSATLVTLCALAALLDAAARIPASDGPLPLTVVLTGQSPAPAPGGAAGGAAARSHGVPIPSSVLGALTSERLLASASVRRTRATVVAYVVAINRKAGAIPLVDSRATSGGAAEATFDSSFKGQWPEYSPITLFADEASAEHALAFMVDYLRVNPTPPGDGGAGPDDGLGGGAAGAVPAGGGGGSGGGQLLPLGQRMPPGLFMALKTSEQDAHGEGGGGGGRRGASLEPQDLAPTLLATGWFAEGDIPGHEALVAYRDALLVFFIGLNPPTVSLWRGSVAGARVGLTLSPALCRASATSSASATRRPSCRPGPCASFQRSCASALSSGFSAVGMMSWGRLFCRDSGSGDLAAVCIGVLGIACWTRGDREAVPGASPTSLRDEHGLGRGGTRAAEESAARAPRSMHPVLDASLSAELDLVAGAAAPHPKRAKKQQPAGAAGAAEPAPPAHAETASESPEARKVSLLARVPSAVLRAAYEQIPAALLLDTAPRAACALIRAMQVCVGFCTGESSRSMLSLSLLLCSAAKGERRRLAAAALRRPRSDRRGRAAGLGGRRPGLWRRAVNAGACASRAPRSCADLSYATPPLSSQEARELACTLTVPHLRIPLALAFFAARPGVLLQPALRVLFTHVLFTPGPYVLADAHSVPAGAVGGIAAAAAEPEEGGADAAAVVVSGLGGLLNALGPLGAVPVAPEHRTSALGHVLGALHLEAAHAPATLVAPLLELLEALLARASGLAPSEGRSPHAAALLWGLRTAVQVEGTLAAVSRDESTSAGDEGDAAALQRADYLARLRALIRGPVRLYLSRCLAAAERANDIPCAAVLHAHAILLWQHADDADLLPQQDDGGAATPGSASSVDHDALLHCGYASLLASGTYVAVWMRTARLRAAADAEAEFARLAEAQGGAGTDGAQNRRSPFMTRPTLPAGYTSSSACDLLPSAPWAAATATTLRHRDALLAWLDAMAAIRVSVLDQGTLLPGSAADVALSHCLRVALRRPRVDLLSFEREGGATSSSAALCRVVVESEHPYRPSTDLFKRLHFPGTPPWS